MKTEAGQRLAGRYVLVAPIGSGGMAEVWQGSDEVLGRTVAVKILHEHLTDDRRIFERFRREAVTAARLSHPSVVRVFDTGIDEGRCFIVLEFVEDRTLAALLQERGRLSVDETVGIARGILEGLAHAHAHGIVHRDLKPGNVLVHDGHVKVADFGIAKAAFTGDLTATGELLGTAAYLAPEQVSGGEIDHRADLYAVGTVLYEMLTGHPPFEAETAIAAATLRLTQDPPPPSTLRAGVPPELEAVVMGALARAPDGRFQSADEMRGALERSTMSAPATPATVAEPPAGSRRSTFRAWMLVPTVAVVLAGIVLGVGLLIGRLELGGPLGVRAREPSPSRTERAAAALEVAGVQAWDPLGDGDEHGENAAEAIDGDPGTAWLTEHYTSADFGGIAGKDGVGIVFDLGEPTDVSELTLLSPDPGWAFEIHAAEEPFTDAASLGPALETDDGSSSFVAEEEMTMGFSDLRARYVLVWITALTDVGGEYRAVISEAAFAGA